MTIPIRPLGKVKELVESIGLDISYAYDDIVFSDHSLFILQFNDNNPNLLTLYFNIDCEEEEQASVQSKLIMAAKSFGLTIQYKSTFALTQVENEENLQIEFHS